MYSLLLARSPSVNAVICFCSAQLVLPRHCMFGNRGCLGCCTKPQLIIAVDEPSKGLKIKGRATKKGRLTQEFWSRSTYEMENSEVQSKHSISSISTLIQKPDSHSNAASTSNPSEFVNHGLILWNTARQQWVGDKRLTARKRLKNPD